MYIHVNSYTLLIFSFITILFCFIIPLYLMVFKKYSYDQIIIFGIFLMIFNVTFLSVVIAMLRVLR